MVPLVTEAKVMLCNVSGAKLATNVAGPVTVKLRGFSVLPSSQLTKSKPELGMAVNVQVVFS